MGSYSPPSIPIVDISDLVTQPPNSPSYRDAAVRLSQACRVNGGVGITGHHLPKELIQKAFDTNKDLFDLPYAEKMKAPHPDGLVPHRGYSGPGREALASSAAVKTVDSARKETLQKTLDHKETYEIGSHNNLEHYNIWLPEDVLPGFKESSLNFFWSLTDFTKMILHALALGGGFTEKECEYITNLHTGEDAALRLLHYPSAKVSKDTTGRLGAHTDWGIFTILFQDSVGGLEFEDLASGEWMPATPQSDTIYLNIADTLTRVTNGLYPSCVHRVMSTPSESGIVPERHSIAYFLAPQSDAVIYPQASRIIADGCMNYEPIVFSVYSERLFSASQKGRATS